MIKPQLGSSRQHQRIIRVVVRHAITGSIKYKRSIKQRSIITRGMLRRMDNLNALFHHW